MDRNASQRRVVAHVDEWKSRVHGTPWMMKLTNVNKKINRHVTPVELAARSWNQKACCMWSRDDARALNINMASFIIDRRHAYWRTRVVVHISSKYKEPATREAVELTLFLRRRWYSHISRASLHRCVYHSLVVWPTWNDATECLQSMLQGKLFCNWRCMFYLNYVRFIIVF